MWSNIATGVIAALVAVVVIVFSYSLGGMEAGTKVRKQCEQFQAFNTQTFQGEAFFYCYREPKK